jgi:hypothetical protein
MPSVSLKQLLVSFWEQTTQKRTWSDSRNRKRAIDEKSVKAQLRKTLYPTVCGRGGNATVEERFGFASKFAMRTWIQNLPRRRVMAPQTGIVCELIQLMTEISLTGGNI